MGGGGTSHQKERLVGSNRIIFQELLLEKTSGVLLEETYFSTGNISSQGPFFIEMLVYQRVCVLLVVLHSFHFSGVNGAFSTQSFKSYER